MNTIICRGFDLIEKAVLSDYLKFEKNVELPLFFMGESRAYSFRVHAAKGIYSTIIESELLVDPRNKGSVKDAVDHLARLAGSKLDQKLRENSSKTLRFLNSEEGKTPLVFKTALAEFDFPSYSLKDGETDWRLSGSKFIAFDKNGERLESEYDMTDEGIKNIQTDLVKSIICCSSSCLASLYAWLAVTEIRDFYLGLDLDPSGKIDEARLKNIGALKSLYSRMLALKGYISFNVPAPEIKPFF
ncbi:MAG: hypothetical protein WC397_03625 [Candidatus Paceibacterota bacterium]